MSDSFAGQMKPPLGVGAIVGDSFSILFRHFFAVVALAFVPTLVGLIISGLLVGWELTLGTGDFTGTPADVLVPELLNITVQLVAYGVTVALLVQLAYDAKLQRPLQLGRYLSPALRAAVPIALLSIVYVLLAMLATIALIVPGLWVYAVFSVMPPAVVIDRAGFGGLGRSAGLTKEYRWPVLGALVLVGICTWVMSYVAGYVSGLILGATGAGGIVLPLVVVSAISAIGIGLGSIAVALIYARLREIKEGIGISDIVSVFD